MILDYIRHYGEDAIGGLHFVGGISKLGSEEALSFLSAEFLSHVPGLLSMDVDASREAFDALFKLCFVQQPSAQELYTMLGYNMSVPPHVRQALFSRTVDNDDLLARLRTPLLITHGENEAIVKRAAADHHKSRVPHAQLQMMANAGHAPFWDDPASFNQGLRQFAESVWSSKPALEQTV